MFIKGKWYTETEAEAYIDGLERRMKELEEKHLSECRQISEYDIENKRLNALVDDVMKKCF